MFITDMWISKNELCPCGSGNKYGACCAKREGKKFHAESEALATVTKLHKKAQVRTCLHRGCTAKSKEIIGAHAIQNNRFLTQLCFDDHVYMTAVGNGNPVILDINGKKEPFFVLNRTHRNQTAVYTCFCGKHDNDIFAPIEKPGVTIDPSNSEQLFLFAYRTFAFEYYKEIATVKHYALMCKEVPSLFKQRMIASQYHQTIIKKREMEHYKKYFDDAMAKNDFSGVETYIIELPYQIQFAAYMSIAPMFDIEGKRVRTVKNRIMRRLFITVFPDNNKSYLYFSFLKTDKRVYQSYFDRLKNSTRVLVLMYLNALIPLLSENIIINPKLFDSWQEEQQIYFQVLLGDIEGNARHRLGFKFLFRNIAKRKLTLTEDNLNAMKFNLFQKT